LHEREGGKETIFEKEKKKRRCSERASLGDLQHNGGEEEEGEGEEPSHPLKKRGRRSNIVQEIPSGGKNSKQAFYIYGGEKKKTCRKKRGGESLYNFGEFCTSRRAKKGPLLYLSGKRKPPSTMHKEAHLRGRRGEGMVSPLWESGPTLQKGETLPTRPRRKERKRRGHYFTRSKSGNPPHNASPNQRRRQETTRPLMARLFREPGKE